MHFTTLTTFFGLATSAFAATASVQNNCPENIWVTVTNSTWIPTQYHLGANGTSYSQPRSGSGNSFGLSKDVDYFNPQTPKFVFGFTDSPADHILYWTVANSNGDPFAGQPWRVMTSDPNCYMAQGYDAGLVHTCSDTADITVVLC